LFNVTLFFLMPRRFSGFSGFPPSLKINTVWKDVWKIVNVGVVSVREKSPQLSGHYGAWLEKLETIKK